MESDTTSNRTVRFGVFEFDLSNRVLYRKGLDTHLEAQPARLLELLVDRPNRVVMREEIYKTLWPGENTGDFDSRINHAIMCIRTILHDDPRSPIYIETVSKRGYRFISQIQFVETREALPPEVSQPGPRPPVMPVQGHGWAKWLIAFGVGIALLVFLLGATLLRARRPHRPVIAYVTPILPQPRQTIVIKGHGFGKYVSFSNLDSPFISVRDKTARWAAGRIMERNFDAVTLSVAAWKDTEIIVTGLYRLYGEHGWKLNPGDKIEIVVWNPQTGAGPASYWVRVADERASR